MYRLKPGQESFQIVDGPDAGRTFERGKMYGQAPAGYENRFERLKVEVVPAAEPKTTTKSKGDK